MHKVSMVYVIAAIIAASLTLTACSSGESGDASVSQEVPAQESSSQVESASGPEPKDADDNASNSETDTQGESGLEVSDVTYDPHGKYGVTVTATVANNGTETYHIINPFFPDAIPLSHALCYSYTYDKVDNYGDIKSEVVDIEITRRGSSFLAFKVIDGEPKLAPGESSTYTLVQELSTNDSQYDEKLAQLESVRDFKLFATPGYTKEYDEQQYENGQGDVLSDSEYDYELTLRKSGEGSQELIGHISNLSDQNLWIMEIQGWLTNQDGSIYIASDGRPIPVNYSIDYIKAGGTAEIAENDRDFGMWSLPDGDYGFKVVLVLGLVDNEQ